VGTADANAVQQPQALQLRTPAVQTACIFLSKYYSIIIIIIIIILNILYYLYYTLLYTTTIHTISLGLALFPAGGPFLPSLYLCNNIYT
jgi:hypothetical protein